MILRDLRIARVLDVDRLGHIRFGIDTASIAWRVGMFSGNDLKFYNAVASPTSTFGTAFLTIAGTSGDVTISSTTASTSTSDGALVVGGGAGINGALSLGGILRFTNGATVTSVASNRGITFAGSSASAVAHTFNQAGAGDSDVVISRTGTTPSSWTIYTPSGSTDLRIYDSADRVTISAGGVVSFSNTTEVSAVGTASVVLSGGLSVGKSLIVQEGQSWGITLTATAAGTTVLTANSRVVQVFTGSSTQNVTLPAANANGAGVAIMFVFKNRSSGNVTINRAGSDTIDGATSYVLLAGRNSITLASDGVSEWSIV